MRNKFSEKSKNNFNDKISMSETPHNLKHISITCYIVSSCFKSRQQNIHFDSTSFETVIILFN